jgi:hypothetical protein
MQREDSSVVRLISSVARRRWWRHFAVSGAVACLIALVLTLGLRMAGLTVPLPLRVVLLLLAAVGASVWSWRFSGRRAAAEAIERARPSCQNLVITAEELERHPERVSAAVGARVNLRADAAIEGLRPSEVMPLRGSVLAFMTAAALMATGMLLPGAPERARRAVESIAHTLRSPDSAPVVRVTVSPPAYTRRAPETLTNPPRLAALDGSTIRFDLPDGWRVRFGVAAASTELVAHESGYFAIEPSGAETKAALLIPLTVEQDRAPVVRITAPAKDLLLADGSRSIPIAVAASDDLGLQALEVRYTKVSGSGEHFEFVEGTLPAAVRRASTREWSADAALALPSLRLAPGDSLVYRAVARDERPGAAGIATSDTYFIEIAGPGQIALEGVDMPPELDRYAMSQQMIVVKLERLRSRQSAMNKADLAEESASLAAEQRTVRANFIFLLGGHVEDEEEEAAQSHEIQEGRLENTARRDINRAISEMTRVEQRLTALDVGSALPPARAAVEALQRAFGRSRYLLRSLAVRGRLDPSRRLVGDLADAGNWRRNVVEPPPREGENTRALLQILLDSAAQSRAGRHPDDARLQRIAELALKIDPAAALWQSVARDVTTARDASALERAAAQVAREAVRGTVPRTGLATSDPAIARAFRAEHRQ